MEQAKKEKGKPYEQELRHVLLGERWEVEKHKWVILLEKLGIKDIYI